jgi:hypothetical protein
MARTRSSIVALPNRVAVGSSEKASYTTACAGANNDLVYTARDRGVGGNSITVRYVVAGNNTPLTVSVSTLAITVNVATDGGGAATSTGTLVAAAVAASTPANALVTVANSGADTGAGVVAAFTVQSLAGGTDFVIGQGSGTVKRVKTRPY